MLHLERAMNNKMDKRFIFIFLLLFILFVPLMVFGDNVDAMTNFSLGFYYLYENKFPEAKDAFLKALKEESYPPPEIYSMLAEITNMMGEREESKKYAQKALELNPDDETSLRILSYILFDEGNYSEAKRYLEKLYRNNPDNLQIMITLSKVYHELKLDDKLIDLYRKILAKNPGLIDVRLNLGYLYTKKGMLELAKKEYSEVLKYDPTNEKAIFYLTYINLSQGNTGEALELFKKLDNKNLLNDEMLEDYAANLFIEGQDPQPVLSRIKDKSKISNLTRAIINFEKGRYSEAKELFEKSIKDDINVIASYTGLIKIAELRKDIDMEKKWRFMLANEYLKLGMYEKALKEAKNVELMDPNYLENRYLLGDIYSAMGMIDRALDNYIYFSKHSEEKGDVFIKIGLLYDEKNEYLNAIESFKKALSYFPKDDKLYFFIGIEYRYLKRYREALKAFKEAIRLNEKNPKYFFNAGVCLERMGNISEAIKYLDESVKLNGNDPIVLNYLGYLLADSGTRLNEAKKYIEKALSKEPENSAYLDSMGWVYYRMGDYERAREYVEKAIKNLNPESGDEENYIIYEHLGDIYLKLGLKIKAINTWQKALKIKSVERIIEKIENVKRTLNGVGDEEGN